jgi:site-specific DNA recombinase
MELMKPECQHSNKEQMLMQVNQQAIELSRALTNVTEQKNGVATANITEKDISEAFQNIEEFWNVLYPAERNRLIRLVIQKVEVRETGIDMEVRTGGLTTLITELAGLTIEIKERT